MRRYYKLHLRKQLYELRHNIVLKFRVQVDINFVNDDEPRNLGKFIAPIKIIAFALSDNGSEQMEQLRLPF